MEESSEQHRLERLLQDLPAPVPVPDLPAAYSFVTPALPREYPTQESFSAIDAKSFHPSPLAASLKAFLALPCMNQTPTTTPTASAANLVHPLDAPITSNAPESSSLEKSVENAARDETRTDAEEREDDDNETDVVVVTTTPAAATEEEEKEKEADEKRKQEKGRPVYDCLPVPKSLLRSKQVKDYLFLCSKPASQRSKEEARHLSMLSSLVARERAAYEQHFMDEAIHNRECYRYVRKDVEELFLQTVRERCDRLLKQLPTQYVLSQSNVEIKKDHSEASVFLQHSGRVFESGSCFSYTNPAVGSMLFGKNSLEATHKHAAQLAEDPVVTSWTSSHDVDVVITASALSTLVEAYSTDSVAWRRLVPVSVLERASHHTVLIDSALPCEHTTSREATERYFARKVDSLMQNPSTKPTQLSFVSPGIDTATENDGNRTVLYNMWNFGELKVLTRGHAHYLSSKRDSTGEPTEIFNGVKVKSHMCSAGGRKEAFTAQEALMWYFKLLLLPRAKTILSVVHADLLSGTVVDVEEVPFSQILSLAPVQVEAASAALHGTLSLLRTLSEGKYVVSVQPGLRSCDIYTELGEGVTSTDAPVLILSEMVKRCNAVFPAEPSSSVMPRWQEGSDRIRDTFQPQQFQSTKLCHKYALEGICTDKACPYAHRAVSEEERERIQTIEETKGKKKNAKHRKEPPSEAGDEHKSKRGRQS